MYLTFAVDMMKPGATVILRNAKIDMYRGSMRLAVDKWGRVEVRNLHINVIISFIIIYVLE